MESNDVNHVHRLFLHQKKASNFEAFFLNNRLVYYAPIGGNKVGHCGGITGAGQEEIMLSLG